MTQLHSRLEAALGAAYRLEKELGGGGMSRVFLAEEVRLGRKVVVKVLPPEMGAGVNVDRFEREIQLAARLQHPHIVPLLTAGAEGDLLYYMMPFIEGESLRAKLAREGELPVTDVLRTVRDVLDALSYAHAHGVVHRDIKPDNVLLTGRHAVVMDFGVAKAVSDSTGGQSLTSLGVALGTPMYMSPEQAAANPHVDHRADLYALGVMAYEMLCGRPPFAGPNVQAVLSAHVTQAPEPPSTHRSTIPPALNELILRCLAKLPADRWQKAEELMPHVEAMLTPTGGTTPTGTQPVISSGTQAAIRRVHPARVAALFGLASAGVLAAVYGIMWVIGLPHWVFLGAVVLLAIGLPIMLVTAHHERERARARTTGHVVSTPQQGVRRWFTWRKALLGGGVAFAGLGVVAAGYMAMRLLGIGPLGTLVATGVLDQQERVLLSDFENATSDPRIGETVTELLRIDLAQSPTISVMEAGQVRDVLERMERDRDAPLTEELASEVAAREGIKAFVAGEVRAVADGFVISARVIEAATGEALVAARESASEPGQLIGAVDRLSARLRGRIGESLRSVRADPPLGRLTTHSLEALRLYAQATRVENQGDIDRAIALLEQAVEQDSSFAMAYRRLGAFYTRRDDAVSQQRGREAATHAYALRDRLSDRERYHVEALYSIYVEDDNERAVTAYLALLEKHPLDPTALNNLAVAYGRLGRVPEREAAYRRAIEAGVAGAVTHTNLMGTQLWAGALPTVDTVLRLFAERFPNSPQVSQFASRLAEARHDWDTAERLARELLTETPNVQTWAHEQLSEIAQVRGQLREAARHHREAGRIRAQRVDMSAEERDALVELRDLERSLFHETLDRAVVAERAERLWRRYARLTASHDPQDRQYPDFVRLLSRAGRPALARRLLDEYRAAFDDEERALRFNRFWFEFLTAEVLIGEERYAEAARQYRTALEPFHGEFAWSEAPAQLGEAYDRAGQADSALKYYEGFVNLEAERFDASRIWYSPLHRRVGELYEARGDREKAVQYYNRFVELWANAEPVLQPQVQDVRERIARLVGEGR